MPDEDIFRAYRFKLDIQGVTAAYFTEVSGLGVKVEAIDYGRRRRAVGAPAPGWRRSTRSPCATAEPDQLAVDWFNEALQGNVTRRDVSIILLGTTASPR